MKKLFILLFCLINIQAILKADNERAIAIDDLPQEALTFIKTHFSDIKISYAKMESDFFKKDYEVVFVNGQKAEFDKNGAWKEIDCKYSFVPPSIIPESIKKYLAEHYPEQNVIKIERNQKEYEVKLKNKLELKFNKAFQLIDIDD